MANAIELPKLSTPSGGSAVRGMGESYTADDFTGAATFRIPIPASACREVTPSLTLGYASGGGNGPFGLGFDVALPRIARRTDGAIPRYDDTDEFMADGEMLVPALAQVGDQWQPVVHQRSEGDVEYRVVRFRKRVDGDGTRFEHWRRLSDNDAHWRIASADGSVAVLGRDASARIADPAAPSHVLAWLIESSATASGDRVAYRYKAEDGANVPCVPSNAGRDQTANRYIAEIRYGAYDDGQGGLAYAMRLLFDYGEYDIGVGNPDPYTPVRAWPARQDPFSSYRSGFEVRTYRLCRGVLMFHALPELGATPCLVGATVLEYTVQDGLSVLSRAVQRGYRRVSEGTYAMLEIPGVNLDYQRFEPALQGFQPVAPASGAFPAPLSQGELIVADLLGEGLPGLLFSTPSACQFWRNLGDGRFAAALTPQAMPVQRDVSAGRQLLTSLQGNGQLDCVVVEGSQAGYYRYQRDAGWSAFQSFPQWAPEAATAAAQYVDLSGAGLADLLVMQGTALRRYPGLGEAGYGDPVALVLQDGVPDPRTASPMEFIDFVDLVGDGGAHLVRIRDGSVECWPSLGYGRFGERVLFDGAPDFPGGFDASRLRVADVSGSGGADLIYFGERQVYLYLNHAGNGFAAPVVVAAPAAYSQLSYAGSADLLGGGSHDLLLGTATQGQWLIDFTGGRKPWLLTAVRGDLGARTELTYGTSSRFALADALAGRPWPCTLPFPVQVVTCVTSTEPFSASRQTLRTAYHDGYYDPIAKSFRGFGHVERWTTQTVDGASFAPPAFTKTWYHTGAFVGGHLQTLQYHKDYWHGIEGRQPTPPDSVIQTLTSPPDAALLRVAHRALKGQLLRSERYGLEGGPVEGVPFTVVSNSYTVSQAQPGRGDHDAVFQVSAREIVTAVYERDAQDPRVGQQFTLEVDAYGHVLLAVDVANMRGNTAAGAAPSSTWPACQTQALVTAQQSCFAAPLEHEGAFVVPPLEQVAYQFGQVAAAGGGWLDFDTVRERARTALQNVLPPEQAFSGVQPQARLRLDTRQVYWDAARTQPLPFGTVAWPVLLHHASTTRFSAGMIAQTYGDRLSAQQLREEGFLQYEDDYWWAPGTITHYGDAAQFYRPLGATDAAGHRVSVTYDTYALLPVAISNADGTALAVPDYQTLQTTTLTDVNGVVDQVLPDALGRVIVATRFHAPAGGTRQGDGDIGRYVAKTAASVDQVLRDPAAYLQQMTAYFYYDDRVGSGQPPVVLSVARQLHVSQLAQGQTTALKLVASYSDALGRPLETRTQVEAAGCGRDQDAWVSNDLVQLDLQGQAVKRWRPRFTDTAAFTADREGWHDTDWRDAQGRVVETLTAKGFIARNVYRAWTGEQWDLDDTLPTSPYYLAHIGDTSPAFADARRALEQAAFFADTYLTQWLDPLGRVVDLEQRNRSADAPDIRSMLTTSVLDLDGRTLALADPRFSARNAGGDTPIWNIVSGYDLAGNTMSLQSVDSGTRIVFNDALGRLAHQWDGRGLHSRREYDAMNRLTQVHVDGVEGVHQVVERLRYGTDAATNSIGRRVELRDATGVLSDGPFDLGGRPTCSRFELRVDYKDEVDWSPGKTVALEPPRTTQSERNAFEQLIDKRCADGSRQRNGYYANGWLAFSDLTLAGASSPTQVVTEAVYSPEGTRASALLGTGVMAVRGYEASTGRLLAIDVTRRGDGKALQQIAYTYDPVGNVTCAEDATVPLVFCNQAQIGARQDYGYDAIYRLLQATGRENPAIGASTYRTGFKQSAYLPLCPENPADGTKLVPYQERYGYDDSGNLVQLVHSTPQSTLSWTRAYAVSQTSNRVVLDDDAGGRDPDAGYDANGNMVEFEHLRSMDWDWRNKPRRAVLIARNGGDDDAQYYIYNSAGQRVRRVTQRLTAGGLQVEDKVYLDGCELVRTLSASGTPEVARTGISVGDGGARVLMAYYWPASDGRAPQWRFQLATVTGSSALEVEADGAVISYEEYFPYGGTAIIAGNAQAEVKLKDYRFCGKECDDATGLYDFGDRCYATWLARWLSPDPNGPVDSPNLYQYVGCNPLSWVDPSGGCKAKIAVPQAGTTAAFSSFETNYRYLTQSEAASYQQLAQDIHEYVYLFKPEATKSYDARLSPQLEFRVLSMFETFKPLHIASNPELLDVFRTAQTKAGVDDDTGGISTYTKMRSPHFTKAMNDTEMGDIVASDDFYRTVELHHGAKKQFLPQFATNASNLWAVSRGGSSYGVVGQHEGAFHTVGAAKFGNIYTTEIGAYTGLMLHWQGLRALPGDDPLDAFKPPPPPTPSVLVPTLPSFQSLLDSIPPSSYWQPVVQSYVPPQPMSWSSSPAPTFIYTSNPQGGFGHPPVHPGW